MREHTFGYTFRGYELAETQFYQSLRLLIKVQYDAFTILMKNIVGSDTQNLIISGTH